LGKGKSIAFCWLGQVHSCVRPVRTARQAAGHDDVGGLGPHHSTALQGALNHPGYTNPRLDRISITQVVLSCPRAASGSDLL
jgi:hypothetical protein